MRTVIIDCGATKADWLCSDGTQVRTSGFNLAHTPADQLQSILEAAARELPDIDKLYLYAAGLVGESPVDLGKWFPKAGIEYASDMLGAARAVCGRRPGIAAIVGTGANTCQYDGENITAQVPCGGYILGDEGAASVLGKLFLSDYLKGFVPEELAKEFVPGLLPGDCPAGVPYARTGPVPGQPGALRGSPLQDQRIRQGAGGQELPRLF